MTVFLCFRVSSDTPCLSPHSSDLKFLVACGFRHFFNQLYVDLRALGPIHAVDKGYGALSQLRDELVHVLMDVVKKE
jgi:hypothetical protein